VNGGRTVRRVVSSLKADQFVTITTLGVGYFALQIIANLTVQKPVELFGSLEIPTGSLLYALTFTWVDMVNDRFGPRQATWLVFVTAAFHVFSIIWFNIYILLPFPSDYSGPMTLQSAIELIFGGYFRIYVSSILTILIAENINIQVFSFVKLRFPQQKRYIRSLVSNTFSVPVDAILFPTFAFAGIISGAELVVIALSSLVYKLIVAYISIPLIYLVKDRLRS